MAEKPTDGRPSPEERYRQLEEESAQWSKRVEESVRELEKASHRRARRGPGGYVGRPREPS